MTTSPGVNSSRVVLTTGRESVLVVDDAALKVGTGLCRPGLIEDRRSRRIAPRPALCQFKRVHWRRPACVIRRQS